MDAANDIVLPDGAPRTGSFRLQNGKVTTPIAGRTWKQARRSTGSKGRLAGRTTKTIVRPSSVTR